MVWFPSCPWYISQCLQQGFRALCKGAYYQPILLYHYWVRLKSHQDCLLQKGAYIDHPFGPNLEIIKVEKKIFAQFFQLKGIDTVEEAENYRNLYIKRKRNKDEKLEKDTYYIVDLIGCRVYTDDQKELGEVIDVFSTGSNDIYVVKDELGKQVLLPAIKDVIKNVDIENRTIIVHLLEGLI